MKGSNTSQTAEHSLEDVAGAMNTLFATSQEPEEEKPDTIPPPSVPATEPVPEGPAESEQPAVTEPQVEESPELVALREQLAAAKRDSEERDTRASHSLNWARQGFLRKSNEASAYKQLLARAAAGEEISREELTRALSTQANGQDAGVQQQPASYGLPFGQPQAQADDRTIIDLEQFVVDTRLTAAEAQKLTEWIHSKDSTVDNRDIVPGDQPGSINQYATMRLIYQKYKDAQGPSPVVAQAAQTVARTQRAVAKATSAPTGRQTPAPAPEPVDVSKLSPEERVKQGLVSQWWETIASQYRP